MKPSLAFTTQFEQLHLKDLAIDGTIPCWLQGSFISNGPAQFGVGSQQFLHWFDGFAMLKRFDFHGNKVDFQNRYILSDQYQFSNQNSQLFTNEFATYAKKTVFARIIEAIKDVYHGPRYDNCNVNVMRLQPHYLALTETSHQIAFDSDTLDTLGHFKYADKIRGQLTLAHPCYDQHTEEFINITTEIGRIIKYHIYKIHHLTKQRILIKTYECKDAFYMHSFSVTKNFIILLQSPLVMNKFKLLLGLPFKNCLNWQKHQESQFIIIDKQTGAVQRLTTDPFVCLHHGNAYEYGNSIILDLICYDMADPYDLFYLQQLHRGGINRAGTLKRFQLDLSSRCVTSFLLSSNDQEFPRINSRFGSVSYQYLYTTGMTNREAGFFNSIRKTDFKNEMTQEWHQSEYILGEAIFVAKPDAQMEDDGVLLSISYNTENQKSGLIIVDARSMQLIAKITLPLHLPMGLHGHFYFSESIVYS